MFPTHNGGWSCLMGHDRQLRPVTTSDFPASSQHRAPDSPAMDTRALYYALLPAGCREAANCRYCFYSRAKNQVFRPAGATRCTDSGQTLQCRRPPGSAWLCKISRQSVQTGGNAAPKISKISTFW